MRSPKNDLANERVPSSVQSIDSKTTAPRDYLAQLAIDDAEQGDFARLIQWMQVLEQAYTWQEGMDEYVGKKPE